MVEHGDRVVGHLFERVRAVRFVAASGTRLSAQSSVPRSGGEPLEVPAVLVGAEALDEQDGRAVGSTGDAVVDPGAVRAANVGHQAPPSPLSGSQSSGVPVRMSPSSASSISMSRPTWSASSSSLRGPRRRRGDRDGAPISRRAAPTDRVRRRRCREDLDAGGERPAHERMVTDLAEPLVVRHAHDHELAGGERSPATSSGWSSKHAPIRRRRAPIGAASGRPTNRTGRSTVSLSANAEKIGASASVRALTTISAPLRRGSRWSPPTVTSHRGRDHGDHRAHEAGVAPQSSTTPACSSVRRVTDALTSAAARDIAALAHRRCCARGS